MIFFYISSLHDFSWLALKSADLADPNHYGEVFHFAVHCYNYYVAIICEISPKTFNFSGVEILRLT